MTSGSGAQSIPKPPRRRLRFALLAAGIGLLVAAIAVVGVVVSTGDRSTASGSSAAPTGSTAAAEEPAGGPSTSATPTAPAVAIPTECEQIYTKDWTDEMDGLVLNPAWALTDPAVQTASRDAVLAPALHEATSISCKWGSPNGGSDRGLTTNIATLTPDAQASTIAYAQDNGYSCYEELGGTRCVVETEPSPDGQSGESHFFRGGIWVATLWVNIQPEGYTHDVVAALFEA